MWHTHHAAHTPCGAHTMWRTHHVAHTPCGAHTMWRTYHVAHIPFGAHACSAHLNPFDSRRRHQYSTSEGGSFISARWERKRRKLLCSTENSTSAPPADPGGQVQDKYGLGGAGRGPGAGCDRRMRGAGWLGVGRERLGGCELGRVRRAQGGATTSPLVVPGPHGQRPCRSTANVSAPNCPPKHNPHLCVC